MAGWLAWCSRLIKNGLRNDDDITTQFHWSSIHGGFSHWIKTKKNIKRKHKEIEIFKNSFLWTAYFKYKSANVKWTLHFYGFIKGGPLVESHPGFEVIFIQTGGSWELKKRNSCSVALFPRSPLECPNRTLSYGLFDRFMTWPSFDDQQSTIQEASPDKRAVKGKQNIVHDTVSVLWLFESSIIMEGWILRWNAIAFEFVMKTCDNGLYNCTWCTLTFETNN